MPASMALSKFPTDRFPTADSFYLVSLLPRFKISVSLAFSECRGKIDESGLSSGFLLQSGAIFLKFMNYMFLK
jgi:hypothetical protein